MRLSKYKVNKFRSVKGTEWIDVDQWTCLVGLNESGKTNFLLPLWKFNPADDATQIDLLLDYPRDEYSEIEEKGRTSASSIAWGVAGGAVAGFISPVRSFIRKNPIKTALLFSVLFGIFLARLEALLAPWLGDSCRELVFKPGILGIIGGFVSGAVGVFLLNLSKQ